MDASCPQWNAAVKSGTITPPAASSSPVAAAVAAPSLVDVMAFSGAAPEITNGRLAMLGFVSAVAAELSSGEWTRDTKDSCTTRLGRCLLLHGCFVLLAVQQGVRCRAAPTGMHVATNITPQTSQRILVFLDA